MHGNLSHDPAREAASFARVNKPASNDVLLHEQVDELEGFPAGTFTRMNGGELLCVARPKGMDPFALYRSSDDGRTWSRGPLLGSDSLVDADGPITPAPTGAFMCIPDDRLVVAVVNLSEKQGEWSEDKHDMIGAKLPCYAAVSDDAGRTWHHIRKLHDPWTGAVRDIVRLASGRILFTSMQMRHQPGRHTVMTYQTDDQGESWQPSNVIDLGGVGHHGGATEGTFVQLRDETLLQYIRTNWGRFWLARSTDGGSYWHPVGPTGVDASSAPGYLKRLASGRVMLVWNRAQPCGRDDFPLQGGDWNWSAVPASNHREELSIAFSDDECRTWSVPTVIARKPGGEISYPAVFEPTPGTVWITCHRWQFKVSLREADFV